jgi:preflagellin peptidase FlaK
MEMKASLLDMWQAIERELINLLNTHLNSIKYEPILHRNMENLSVLRLLIGMVFFGFASYSDVKTRRVRNEVWMVLGLIGFLILGIDLLNQPDATWVHYLIFIPAGILFYEVYIERDMIIDEGFHFVPLGFALYGAVVVVLALQGFLLYQDPAQMELFLRLLTIPAMIVVAHIFFQTSLLKGGADAKALMSLAVLVPFYPAFYGFPVIELGSLSGNFMSIVFPFSLVILMNSAILTVFAPLVFLAINARKGNLEFPQCLFGYKARLSGFPRFAWLMERARDGRVEISVFPKRKGNREEEIQALTDLGREEAWATPQLPFMVPMFFGILISFFLGNLVLGLVLLFT